MTCEELTGSLNDYPFCRLTKFRRLTHCATPGRQNYVNLTTWPPSRWSVFHQPFHTGDSQLVTRSTRHTVNSSQVNSSPGRLVTRLTRHTVDSSHGQLVTRSTRHTVNSSHSQLVTKRRSTRHKQTSKPFCRSSIITLTRIVRDRRRYEKMHKKLSRKQSEQQSTRTR